MEELVGTPQLIEGLQDDLLCLICGYNIRITLLEGDHQRASCDRCEKWYEENMH